MFYVTPWHLVLTAEQAAMHAPALKELPEGAVVCAKCVRRGAVEVPSHTHRALLHEVPAPPGAPPAKREPLKQKRLRLRPPDPALNATLRESLSSRAANALLRGYYWYRIPKPTPDWLRSAPDALLLKIQDIGRASLQEIRSAYPYRPRPHVCPHCNMSLGGEEL